MQILIPVMVTLILGTVLTHVFSGNMAVADMRVLYTNQSAENEKLTQYIESYFNKASESGITFIPIDSSEAAKLNVANNVYIGYVDISDEGLHFLTNSERQVEGDLVRSFLITFAERYQLAMEIEKTDVEQAKQITTVEKEAFNYVRDVSLEGSRQPSAMDYYAIAMITLVILYGALSAADLIDVERKKKTADRLLAAPISKIEILTGKVIGSLLQNFISVIIVVLICKYMFTVYWGEQLGLVLLILLTEIIFALSLGVGMSYICNSNIAGAIIMILIQIGAFFGGSYFPTIEMTGVLRIIANLFPLTWVNDALIKLIYMNNSLAAVYAMLLNIGFAVLLLGAALFIMRKREGI